MLALLPTGDGVPMLTKPPLPPFTALALALIAAEATAAAAAAAATDVAAAAFATTAAAAAAAETRISGRGEPDKEPTDD